MNTKHLSEYLKSIFLIFFTLLTSFSLAQDFTKTSGLLTELEAAGNDEERFKKLYYLTRAYAEYETDSAVLYGKKALALAEKGENLRQQADVLFFMSKAYALNKKLKAANPTGEENVIDLNAIPDGAEPEVLQVQTSDQILEVHSVRSPEEAYKEAEKVILRYQNIVEENLREPQKKYALYNLYKFYRDEARKSRQYKLITASAFFPSSSVVDRFCETYSISSDELAKHNKVYEDPYYPNSERVVYYPVRIPETSYQPGLFEAAKKGMLNTSKELRKRCKEQSENYDKKGFGRVLSNDFTELLLFEEAKEVIRETGRHIAETDADKAGAWFHEYMMEYSRRHAESAVSIVEAAREILPENKAKDIFSSDLNHVAERRFYELIRNEQYQDAFSLIQKFISYSTDLDYMWAVRSLDHRNETQGFAKQLIRTIYEAQKKLSTEAGGYSNGYVLRKILFHLSYNLTCGSCGELSAEIFLDISNLRYGTTIDHDHLTRVPHIIWRVEDSENLTPAKKKKLISTLRNYTVQQIKEKTVQGEYIFDSEYDGLAALRQFILGFPTSQASEILYSGNAKPVAYHIERFYDLGFRFQLEKNFSEARRAFQKALELSKAGNVPLMQELSLTKLAYLKLAEGKKEEARALYKKAEDNTVSYFKNNTLESLPYDIYERFQNIVILRMAFELTFFPGEHFAEPSPDYLGSLDIGFSPDSNTADYAERYFIDQFGRYAKAMDRYK